MPELPPYELAEEAVNVDKMADDNCPADETENLNVSIDAISSSPHRNAITIEPEGAPIDAVISAIAEESLLEKQEKTSKNTVAAVSANEHTPRKSKKAKKNRTDFSDLLNLPNLNLSESDSSSGSDDDSYLSGSAENSRHSMQSLFEKKAAAQIATASVGAVAAGTVGGDAGAAVDETDTGKLGGSDSDIWASFKAFQTHQSLDLPDEEIDDETHMERMIAKKLVILHVTQSDHDYVRMYKTGRGPKIVPHAPTATPIIEEAANGEIIVTVVEAEPSEEGKHWN